MSSIKQMTEIWKIEHADFGMGIASQIFEDDIMTGVGEGIRNAETTKKISGFNVRHTTMYGSSCSGIYFQNKDPRIDDNLLNP